MSEITTPSQPESPSQPEAAPTDADLLRLIRDRLEAAVEPDPEQYPYRTATTLELLNTLIHRERTARAYKGLMEMDWRNRAAERARAALTMHDLNTVEQAVRILRALEEA